MNFYICSMAEMQHRLHQKLVRLNQLIRSIGISKWREKQTARHEYFDKYLRVIIARFIVMF